MGKIQKSKPPNNANAPGQEKRRSAYAVVNIFFDEISQALATGHRVEIRGLCLIHIKKYTAKTGKKVKVKRKKLPFFKAGKELKELVDR